jgi:hypothetical protein
VDDFFKIVAAGPAFFVSTGPGLTRRRISRGAIPPDLTAVGRAR